MKMSFYIIKPHGLMYRSEARAMIINAGLCITESKEVILPKWTLEIIYSDLPEKYREVVFRPFIKSMVEIGLVMGEDAVSRLLEVAGREIDPADCEPGSIRFQWGCKGHVMVDGVKCYSNIIHRPRNIREAESFIKIFKDL